MAGTIPPGDPYYGGPPTGYNQGRVSRPIGSPLYIMPTTLSPSLSSPQAPWQQEAPLPQGG